ncbi:MAG: phosphoenolpyruvate carboxykinase (ATP), partial [Planctomycetota bacterium]
MAAQTTIPAGRSADTERRLRAFGRWLEADRRHGLPDEWPDECLDSRRPADSLRELRCAAVEHFARKGWVVCHAAAFGEGRVALVPGASGSGKSTLAVTLAREGLAVSDELVFLREEGGCVVATAAPLPLSVSAETLSLLPFAEAWRLGPCVRNGDEEKALLIAPRPLLGTHEVAAVVIRGPMARGRAASLVKADARAAVLGLLGSTY